MIELSKLIRINVTEKCHRGIVYTNYFLKSKCLNQPRKRALACRDECPVMSRSLSWMRFNHCWGRISGPFWTVLGTKTSSCFLCKLKDLDTDLCIILQTNKEIWAFHINNKVNLYIYNLSLGPMDTFMAHYKEWHMNACNITCKHVNKCHMRSKIANSWSQQQHSSSTKIRHREYQLNMHWVL